MSSKRQFISEGVAQASSVCPTTGTKFSVRMLDKHQGKIEVYAHDGDSPNDSWLLARDEMKALFRVLSQPVKE